MTEIIAKRTSRCRNCLTVMNAGETIWFIKRIGAFCTEKCVMTDIDGWLAALDEKLIVAESQVDDLRVLIRVQDPTDGVALERLDGIYEALKHSLWFLRRKHHWDDMRRKKAEDRRAAKIAARSIA